MSAWALFQQSQNPFNASGSGVRAEKPVKRFVKDIAHVGTYKHPRDGWTLDITGDKLNGWAANFRKMKENGVDVAAVVDHRHDAEAVRGYWTDMFVEGDRLKGVVELTEDGAKLAEAVRNVSPWIEKSFTDGKGNAYGEAITHVGIVQMPVIPNQEPFQAMAASLAGRGDALVLTTDKDNDMDLKPLRLALGIADDVTDEAALTDTIARIGELKTLKANAPKVKAEPDADVLGVMAEATAMSFDGLAEKGCVSPAVRDKLKALFVGTEGKFNAYALSASYSGRDKPLAREVVAILAENKPVPANGTKSGAQVMALSAAGAGDADQKKKDNEAAAKLLKAGAGIK